MTHKSLNFDNLSLELDNVQIFQQESNTSGILILYSVRKCIKLEGPIFKSAENLNCKISYILGWFSLGKLLHQNNIDVTKNLERDR